MEWKLLKDFKKSGMILLFFEKDHSAANSLQAVYVAFAVIHVRWDGGLDLNSGYLSEKK